jgi:N-acetylglutamate synthase-like GNAT family acetyltransferase
MKLIELELPEYIDSSTNPEVTRALSLYSVLHPELNPAKKNDLLELVDYFDHKKAFVVHDADGRIQAIANFEQRTASRTDWLEGIAVNSVMRGIGIGQFMVQGLIDISASEGQEAIELRPINTPKVENFYRKQGFNYINEKSSTMRRDVGL